MDVCHGLLSCGVSASFSLWELNAVAAAFSRASVDSAFRTVMSARFLVQPWHKKDCDSSHRLRGCHLQQGHRGHVRTTFFTWAILSPTLPVHSAFPCKVMLASFCCWKVLKLWMWCIRRFLHGRSTSLCVFNLSVFMLTLFVPFCSLFPGIMSQNRMLKTFKKCLMSPPLLTYNDALRDLRTWSFFKPKPWSFPKPYQVMLVSGFLQTCEHFTESNRPGYISCMSNDVDMTCHQPFSGLFSSKNLPAWCQTNMQDSKFLDEWLH